MAVIEEIPAMKINGLFISFIFKNFWFQIIMIQIKSGIDNRNGRTKAQRGMNQKEK